MFVPHLAAQAPGCARQLCLNIALNCDAIIELQNLFILHATHLLQLPNTGKQLHKVGISIWSK
jgi:hypothetical protein